MKNRHPNLTSVVRQGRKKKKKGAENKRNWAKTSIYQVTARGIMNFYCVLLAMNSMCDFPTCSCHVPAGRDGQQPWALGSSCGTCGLDQSLWLQTVKNCLLSWSIYRVTKSLSKNLYNRSRSIIKYNEWHYLINCTRKNLNLIFLYPAFHYHFGKS